MQPDDLKDSTTKASWSVLHPVSQEDSAIVAAMRSVVAPMKGKAEGTAGRGPFNDIMERVAGPMAVTFEAARVGGISGYWARPVQARQGGTIIHIHGGWFNWGSAQAFLNFVGHVALSAGSDTFAPDYRLFPHHPLSPCAADRGA